MAFAITSHNIRVEDSILKADAEPRDGSVTRASTLDLNLFIGNCDGSFDVPGSGFYASAREISYDDRTHVLRALLKKGSGGDIEWVPAALYLNAYVTNDDGDLRFLIPSEQLPDSCVGLHLHNSNLKALCVGSDGTLHPSKIDLDRYFENKDGELEFTGLDPSSTAPPGFYRDSRNIYVRIASNWTAYLYADLRCTAGNYKSVAKDISAYVSNRRGRLMLVVSNDMPSLACSTLSTSRGDMLSSSTSQSPPYSVRRC
ncbi:hypothetical protein C8Q77DRAFT_1120153 [Trametes polyzona]|nr:hypothetical protein C8Q77DRAFT_1120153 [Trametes polyzona]